MNLNEIKSSQSQITTPSYIFDIDTLTDELIEIKRILGKEIKVCYAMKANPFLIEKANANVDRFEVCSPGEFEICMNKKIAPEKIIVSGVNKTVDSINRIMDLSEGKSIYTIESEKHYDILSQIANERKIKIKVLIRLTSGNQFGVSDEVFLTLVEKIKSDVFIELQGLHYYSGTQKKMKKVEKELAKLEEFSSLVEEKCGIKLQELEYGPGLLVNYFEAEEDVNRKEQLEDLKKLLDNITKFDNISLEMGRFIASDCGYYITEVNDTKINKDYNFCIVDGGIHQINYYGQVMGMKKPFMYILTDNQGEEIKWNICGSLCTVNDVILKDISLPQLSVGDRLVFRRCGAYSVTEGMALFLSRELPEIYFYENSSITKARNKIETNLFNQTI